MGLPIALGPSSPAALGLPLRDPTLPGPWAEAHEGLLVPTAPALLSQLKDEQRGTCPVGDPSSHRLCI